jgi:hypothetical protein
MDEIQVFIARFVQQEAILTLHILAAWSLEAVDSSRPPDKKTASLTLNGVRSVPRNVWMIGFHSLTTLSSESETRRRLSGRELQYGQDIASHVCIPVRII